MKLRNKKTGEIVSVQGELTYDDKVRLLTHYGSLAELNEKWEDYEEPKKYWFIDAFGNIVQNEITKHYGDEYTDMTDAYERQKQIGNHFETKEEAEKALEKLKAWKRLKDRGFRFDGYNACSVDYDIDEQYRKYISQDLNLLFGGEE